MGQPPAPNAVTTRLSDSVSFEVYNDAGSVDVTIDGNGYLVPSGGIIDFEVESVSTPFDFDNPGDFTTTSVSCPDGTHVTGGGASIVNNDGLDLKTSIPMNDLSGWSAGVIAEDSPFTGTLNIYAVCASGVALAP